MATAFKPDTRISDAEHQARQQLAACYRVFDHLGWSEMIYNHITLKIPGEDGAFLINPFGLHFGEVKASNLVKIDIDGNKLDDSPYPVNRAGFVQHALFHRHLPDAHCIMHTHTTAGMAVSSVAGGLRPTNFYACNFAGQIAYHDFEGVTVRDEEGERLLANLGSKRVMLLRNHGILVMGKTLPEAFIKHWSLQRACEIQVAGAALGPTVPVPEAIQRKCSADALQFDPRYGGGRDVFDALTRLVARADSAYRE